MKKSPFLESLPLNQLLPLLNSVLIIGVGTFILVSLFGFKGLYATPFVYILAGCIIGYQVTPGLKETDNRGTYVIMALMLSWAGYISLSPRIIPELSSLAQWIWQIMGLNIIHGFMLILGAYLGSKIYRRNASLK